jgi:hypothetical protein
MPKLKINLPPKMGETVHPSQIVTTPVPKAKGQKTHQKKGSK